MGPWSDTSVRSDELIRDAAAEIYGAANGEVWSPWRGSRRGSRLTAAQLEAKQALRAIARRQATDADPGGPVVAFRAAPFADSGADASRIFDVLNWARTQWPDMALATTGAKGAGRLAIRWAQKKNVTLVLARADFDRHGKAAPFRANDELMALEPVCCLTLAQLLDAGRASRTHPFGPALTGLARQRRRPETCDDAHLHWPFRAVTMLAKHAIQTRLGAASQVEDPDARVALPRRPLGRGLRARGVGVFRAHARDELSVLEVPYTPLTD